MTDSAPPCSPSPDAEAVPLVGLHRDASAEIREGEGRLPIAAVGGSQNREPRDALGEDAAGPGELRSARRKGPRRFEPPR